MDAGIQFSQNEIIFCCLYQLMLVFILIISVNSNCKDKSQKLSLMDISVGRKIDTNTFCDFFVSLIKSEWWLVALILGNKKLQKWSQ